MHFSFKVYNLLFTNSNFYFNFQKDRGSTELDVSDWEQTERCSRRNKNNTGTDTHSNQGEPSRNPQKKTIKPTLKNPLEVGFFLW